MKRSALNIGAVLASVGMVLALMAFFQDQRGHSMFNRGGMTVMRRADDPEKFAKVIRIEYYVSAALAGLGLSVVLGGKLAKRKRDCE